MKRLFFALIFISAMIITLSACGHEHSYGEWETKKEATCTEEGQKERTCECGEKETASIKKVEHTAVTISEIKPTCTETGYSQGEKCSVCEAVIKEPTLLPAAHGYVPKVIATPGCPHSNAVFTSVFGSTTASISLIIVWACNSTRFSG